MTDPARELVKDTEDRIDQIDLRLGPVFGGALPEPFEIEGLQVLDRRLHRFDLDLVQEAVHRAGFRAAGQTFFTRAGEGRTSMPWRRRTWYTVEGEQFAIAAISGPDSPDR